MPANSLWVGRNLAALLFRAGRGRAHTRMEIDRRSGELTTALPMRTASAERYSGGGHEKL